MESVEENVMENVMEGVMENVKESAVESDSEDEMVYVAGDASLLSAAEIDARYLSLLRTFSGDDVAEHFDMKRRFKHIFNDRILVAKRKSYGKVSVSGAQAPQNIDGLTEDRGPSAYKKSHSMASQGKKYKKGESVVGLGSKSVQADNLSLDFLETTEEEEAAAHILKEFLIFLIFLIVVNIIAFGVVDHAYDYYASVLSDLITRKPFPTRIGIEKSFYQIRTIEQIWDFIDGIFLEVIYSLGSEHSKGISKKDGVLILFENLIIGVPRIRQQRVRNDSCYIHSFFDGLFDTCFGYYYDNQEDKSPFGIRLATAWTYTEPDIDSSVYSGKISSYGGGGFMVNLTNSKETSQNWTDQLRSYNWIQHGTRAVFIDFTTYTPNTNLFCVVKLVFELPPTGGVIPSAHFYTLKFLRYVNTTDHFVLGCEIVFLCFVVYYTMEEVRKMFLLREDYFLDVWNFLELVILAMTYAVVTTACIRYVTISRTIVKKMESIPLSSHASFDSFVYVQTRFNDYCNLLAFFIWLKLLKFATLNRNVALIIRVFGCIKLELLALTMMMISIVLGFALMGNMMFGTHVQQFTTIWSSFYALVGIFVGGLHFYFACTAAHPYFAPLYFTAYIFLVLLLFLNAFVAVITNGFHKAMENPGDESGHIYMNDIFRLIGCKLLWILRKKELAHQMKDKKMNKKNRLDYEEVISIVKKHGFRGMDITMMMKRHQISPNAPVLFENVSDLYNKIDAGNQLMIEAEEHDKLIEMVNLYSGRVENVDKSLSDIVVKVDAVINRVFYNDNLPSKSPKT